MRAILLAMALVASLSGCSSFLLKDAIDSRSRLSYWDSLQVRTAPEFRVMLCPRVGSPGIYRIDAFPRPLFLNLDAAVLSDSLNLDPPRRMLYLGPDTAMQRESLEQDQPSDSIPWSDTLELVLGTSPLGFAPSAPHADRPRALLVLAPNEKRLGKELGEQEDSPLRKKKERIPARKEDGIPVSDGEILLLSRHKGQMKSREVKIFLDKYEEEIQRTRKNRLSTLYALTVPLDIVTSPIQLGVIIIVAPFALLFASGLGSSRW